MNEYKGITFAEGYNKSFADFKKEFASTHIFKNIPSDQREAELEKAYEVATKVPEVNPQLEVEKKLQKNGNSKTISKNSQSDSAR